MNGLQEQELIDGKSIHTVRTPYRINAILREAEPSAHYTIWNSACIRALSISSGQISSRGREDTVACVINVSHCFQHLQ